MRAIGMATLGFALAIASPSLACSVTDEYRVPTNLELTIDADLIVLAKIESGPSGFEFREANLVVTPIEVLKGRLPPGQLKLPGSIAEPRFSVLSSPMELEQAHPLAYIGGCTRYMFVREATVLFFLTQAEKAFKGEEVPVQMRGMLMAAGGPFSRWAEDVLSANSPWVRATRIYLKVAGLPKDQQPVVLKAERDALIRAGDQESKLIAEDIDRQLRGPNKAWNQSMQEEIAKLRARGKDPLEEAADALDEAADAIENDK